MKNILITGGTGLVGKELTKLLVAKNCEVRYLSRTSGTTSDGIKKYAWDLNSHQIDQEAISWADGVINLAGANVGEGRWTQKRKKAIYDSRIDSVKLLSQAIEKADKKPEVFISASAIGIYGFGDSDEKFNEESNHANDFLATVTKDWEKEIDQIATLGLRTVKLRIGVVLAKEGGALPKIIQPIKLLVGAPLGSGKQILSWIHLNDLSRLFVECLENKKYTGAYNAVAPKPVSNAELTVSVAKILKKPLWLPNVPSFVLKTLLGEMALIAIRGSFVDCKKIIDHGFTFLYEEHTKALEDLIS